ncbi:MAG: DUF1295 domain-containing protein [Pirellulaceae bacterium]|nr:DUF1295 domain-containing protein [Pirellulaceae bacterium]
MMTGLWLLSVVRRDASIVDPFWGSGFVVLAWFAVWSVPEASSTARVWLLVTLTTVWGLRLSAYLLWRNLGHGEDRRYQAMRQHHGPHFWWLSLLTVFWLQSVILWFVAMPILVAIHVAGAAAISQDVGASQVAASQASFLSGLDWFAASLWCIGLFFEALGDWQMARFQRDPANRGQVMDRGLWRYTRHPNYFGDFCIWWGIYLIAAAGGAAWTIASPLLMSYFLLKVSGVTLLERTITTRRPAYAAYQRRTNAFFPGPRRDIA